MSDTRGANGSQQLPISAHPAFPAIVALWFAALLGLGSLVLPSLLLERLAVGSGLSSVIAAAEPPLGVTARMLVAVGAAAVGALAGLLIARRVIAAHQPQPVTRRAAMLRPASGADEGRPFAKRPISAHDELGAGGLDGEADDAPRAALAVRRRTLSVTDESARSEFLDFAPLPGHAYGDPAEPLDLDAFAEPEPQPEPEPEAEAAPAPETDAEPAADEHRERSPEVHADIAPAPRAEPAAATATTEAAMPQPSATMPAATMPFVRRVRPEDAAPATGPEPDAPGIVDLVERFARALERHRAQAQAAAIEDEPAPLVFPPANAFTRRDDAPPAMPAALRQIDLDADDDDGADAEAAAPLSGFQLTAAFHGQPRPFTAPSAAAATVHYQVDDSDEDAEIAEDGYTSLLAMKTPPGPAREPVRIEDDGDDGDNDGSIEPAVVFPGQHARRASPMPDAAAAAPIPPGFRAFDRAPSAAAPANTDPRQPFAPIRAPDPRETERALREALDKLQRLSGAA